ncbi:MAG: hypothetical protein ACI8V2_004485 [Candidatus Latescibacterota bacterium]|jgi:hypothetical protein
MINNLWVTEKKMICLVITILLSVFGSINAEDATPKQASNKSNFEKVSEENGTLRLRESYDLLPLDVYSSTENIEVALWLVSDYLSDDRHPSMAVSFSYRKNEYSTFKSYVDADEIAAIESFLNTISGDEGAAILSKKTIDFISIRHASTEMHFTTRSGLTFRALLGSDGVNIGIKVAREDEWHLLTKESIDTLKVSFKLFNKAKQLNTQ